jgi:transcriptional regulator with XRE-family HTH domain
MKMNDQVFKQRAMEENNGIISVGGLPMRLTQETVARPDPLSGAVLGTLISFQRRALHLSLEALASKTAIGLEELLRIEDDPTYKAEPATILRLAKALRLPASQLLILSGNDNARNEKLHKAALLFSARVHETEKLNREQAKALHDFVQALMEAA